ncbi:Arabinanolytic transcriptional activator araR [Talaromyces atroroseus]|uniref:Arabinanolytic transcriptional activator araR n=1 Tax=Talaromyces atroroseus TaxID=1441469 RepID=A0A225ALN0_TALAT|nr:Arabinanolytic transcriptional activator araR [Talaromyces atroroseus]OKL56469.1 Arabinanolytic transcriptional activator araR [Talaromyces atroroseus]
MSAEDTTNSPLEESPEPEDQAIGPETTPADGVKKRWRRNRVACDACHTRRVRCDRAFPCSRCIASQTQCELTRERRKRGRIPRSEYSRRDSSFVVQDAQEEAVDDQKVRAQRKSTTHQPDFISMVTNPPPTEQIAQTTNFSPSAQTSPGHPLPPSAQGSGERQSQLQPSPRETIREDGKAVEDWMSSSNGFVQQPFPYPILGNLGLSDGFFDVSFDMMGMNNMNGHQLSRCRSRQPRNNDRPQRTGETPLKYPVLAPLMPFLEPYLSRDLVYDLLDLYFTSAFSTAMHPACHHIHCYVVRKSSFLSRENPRVSSPALLASMLWVAALDDRTFSLSISPPKRKKLCQFLCALTVRLLRPLIHVSFKENESFPIIDNDHIFPSAAHDRTHSFEGGGDDRGLVGPAGSLDDVVTYIHVASIISSSEQKAASMRWWHAAFTLARELRLNQEVEATSNLNSPVDSSNVPFEFAEGTWYGTSRNGANWDFLLPSGRANLNCVCTQQQHRPNLMTEEHREERRRTWWLLYIMDRHLALCYNHPLALLDAECDDLLLPLEEGPWQAGDIHSNSSKADGPQCPVSGDTNRRRCFPNFTCNDHSVFGFYLPLMAITGELINLNQAKNHPMLGTRLQGKDTWDVQVNEVLRQLDTYKATLQAFATHYSPTTAVPPTSPPVPPLAQQPPGPSQPQQQTTLTPPMLNEPAGIDEISYKSYHSWHTQTVVAYASYVVHVLHILLMGKWDPVSLLEDKDFWTSSPTFASTISHALEAANTLERILHYDPDISFMPDFFGIQLLQGSFLLLLIVERLQNEAGEGILKACEVVIRATESCVVTLNTEYQRNFRQVMRSAVAQARGRPVNHSEIWHRRKAVLALYRWTRNGTGLAL